MADASAISLTVLVDNRARPPLQGEHGFSALIEIMGRRVLFDTGQGPCLLPNARALGQDLSDLDAVALSHGHYDHTGGLPQVVAGAGLMPVYALPGLATPRYCLDGSVPPRAVHMPDAARDAMLDRPLSCVRWVTTPQEIVPGLHLSGPIPRANDFEDSGGPFYLDAGGEVADPLDDDQALWLDTAWGTVLVLGCCHVGLANTLEHVRAHTGGRPVRGVLGGMHLLRASAERLERTCAALAAAGVDLLAPCHCTGDRAVERLRQAFGPRVQDCRAGMSFQFGPDGVRVI
jgi:7,8-dihydropterin-6-yl-methyl-4-(beta-D-ribofuranosyl)aminobenzene 5'-phosphate synthase